MPALNRRHFIKAGLAASASLASLSTLPTSAAVTKSSKEPFHGLKVGLTTYSLRNFKLDQALSMTKEAGVKYISLKEVHLPLKSTKEQREEVAAKVRAAGLVLMGGGVIYFKNVEADIRNVFEYAAQSGMKTIVCSPEPEALETVEKYVKQHDIRIAIHNHGPGDKRYPSPLDVLRLVKDRDERMGVCMDVGHTVRIGQDPVEAIEKCAPRLYEFHMKDVTAANGDGKSTAVGRGVIDIPAVLHALVAIKWRNHVALEYEANGDHPMPGIIESIGYMRGVLDSTP